MRAKRSTITPSGLETSTNCCGFWSSFVVESQQQEANNTTTLANIANALNVNLLIFISINYIRTNLQSYKFLMIYMSFLCIF